MVLIPRFAFIQFSLTDNLLLQEDTQRPNGTSKRFPADKILRVKEMYKNNYFFHVPSDKSVSEEFFNIVAISPTSSQIEMKSAAQKYVTVYATPKKASILSFCANFQKCPNVGRWAQAIATQDAQSFLLDMVSDLPAQAEGQILRSDSENDRTSDLSSGATGSESENYESEEEFTNM